MVPCSPTPDAAGGGRGLTPAIGHRQGEPQPERWAPPAAAGRSMCRSSVRSGGRPVGFGRAVARSVVPVGEDAVVLLLGHLAEAGGKFAHAFPGVLGAGIVTARERVDDLQTQQLVLVLFVEQGDEGVRDGGRPVVGVAEETAAPARTWASVSRMRVSSASRNSGVRPGTAMAPATERRTSGSGSRDRASSASVATLVGGDSRRSRQGTSPRTRGSGWSACRRPMASWSGCSWSK